MRGRRRRQKVLCTLSWCHGWFFFSLFLKLHARRDTWRLSHCEQTQSRSSLLFLLLLSQSVSHPRLILYDQHVLSSFNPLHPLILLMSIVYFFSWTLEQSSIHVCKSSTLTLRDDEGGFIVISRNEDEDDRVRLEWRLTFRVFGLFQGSIVEDMGVSVTRRRVQDMSHFISTWFLLTSCHRWQARTVFSTVLGGHVSSESNDDWKRESMNSDNKGWLFIIEDQGWTNQDSYRSLRVESSVFCAVRRFNFPVTVIEESLLVWMRYLPWTSKDWGRNREFHWKMRESREDDSPWRMSSLEEESSTDAYPSRILWKELLYDISSWLFILKCRHDSLSRSVSWRFNED